ncbi:MAG: prepilin peptidase [Candidatus Omnitrophota bacterium]|nr:prepilin peptidase [Candidatus Omnitrophota bacterium]
MIEKMLAFVFGSIVGSFLNVCISRMPEGESVVWPSSHCPSCKKRIPAYDNIPFLSYILLKGRCRFCKKRISLRYPFVEFLSAVMFVMLFNRYGMSYDLFFYIILVSSLIIASFIDIRYRIIPDEISVGGLVIGFVLSALKGLSLNPGLKPQIAGFGFLTWNTKPILDSFLGIIIGGGIIYLTGVLFDLVYFKFLKRPPIQGETESIGGGDVKLLAMIGAFLGWQKAIFVFFIAPFFGAIIGIINLLAKKDHTIPYGPFLSLAALILIFWAERIISLIFPMWY